MTEFKSAAYEYAAGSRKPNRGLFVCVALVAERRQRYFT
jgi:hypothetical protein